MKCLIPYFTNSNNEFSAIKPNCLQAIKDVERDAIKTLALQHKVDIIFIDSTEHQSIEKHGWAAITYDTDLILLFVDPNDAHLDWDNLRLTLYHELTHAINRTVNPWEQNKSLLDMLISEGIAVYAETHSQYTSGRSQTKWGDISETKLQAILTTMKPHFNDTAFYIDTYFGSSQNIAKGLPSRAGYYLGYFFIQTFMQDSALNLADLAVTPYSVIKRSLSKEKII